MTHNYKALFLAIATIASIGSTAAFANFEVQDLMSSFNQSETLSSQTTVPAQAQGTNTLRR
jgi:hypothetical protein